MSLFIGKDNNEMGVLHITNGETTLADMKSGVIDATVFHSSLPYMLCDMHEVNDVTNWDKDTKTCFIRVPDEAIDIMVDTNNIFFIIYSDDGVWYESPYNDKQNSDAWYASDSIDSDYSAIPSRDYPYLNMQHLLDNPDDVYFVLLNMSWDGNYYYSPDKSNISVVLGDGELSVNGNDLLDLVYVSPDILNDTDIVVQTFSSSFQLIGSTVSNTDKIALKSNSGGTTILAGDTLLFDSNHKSKTKYYKQFSFTFDQTDLTFNDEGDVSFIFLSSEDTFLEGDMFIGSITSDDITYTLDRLYKYATDDILGAVTTIYFDGCDDGDTISFTSILRSDADGNIYYQIECNSLGGCDSFTLSVSGSTLNYFVFR